MSLSPIKCKILEILLLNDKPAEVGFIANECGTDVKAVRMHLMGLNKMGYTISPAKGQYTLTSKGKQFLGITEMRKENAKQLLTSTSKENAFHFYTDMDKPTDIYAYGLKDFAEKIQKISSASLDFHLSRDDFEKWFYSIGDTELAKKMALLKNKAISGEQLRIGLREIVENRCIELSTLA
jgi:predicted transcriptional regulator